MASRKQRRLPGVVRQLKSGRWQVVITLPGGAQLSKTFDTQQQAEDARLTYIQTYLDPRNSRRGEKMTVAALLEKWLEHQDGRIAASTHRTYRLYAEKRILPELGARPLHLLSIDDVDDFYRDLTRSGLAANTVRQIHAILRASLTWAVKRRYVDMNVALYADPPPIGKSAVKAPTEAQVRTLLAEADKHAREFGVAVRLAAATGARRGTIACLRQSDVSFLNATIAIERSLSVVGGKHIEKGLKAGKGGPVPVDDATLAVVADYFAYLHERARVAGERMVDDFYLFSSAVDGSVALHPDTLTKWWETVRRKAGFPTVRFHDLRHFVPTSLFAAGFDAVTIADRLKHASAKMTLDVYGHAVSERAREAGDWLGGRLS